MTLAAGREVTIAEKSKILLVDDQPENLFSEAAVLERLGQEVVQAQSGKRCDTCWMMTSRSFCWM